MIQRIWLYLTARRQRDSFMKGILLLSASSSIIFLTGIVVVLFTQGLPIFRKVPLKAFLLGHYWYPTYSPPDFGILPLILGSIWVTVGATIVALPLGIAAAIYISQVAPRRIAELVKPVVELLAAIPSVVYGFFGMAVFAIWVQEIFQLPTGLTAFTASVILGIMAIPTITSVAEDAISSVPAGYNEASLALGATKWETITRVIVPAASSGIITAIILGVGRVIGETMTVLMVAGGAAVIPTTFFQPVRTMTATIAAEMGEAPMGSDHYHALFAIAIVLFLITLILNGVADFIAQRSKVRIGDA